MSPCTDVRCYNRVDPNKIRQNIVDLVNMKRCEAILFSSIISISATYTHFLCVLSSFKINLLSSVLSNTVDMRTFNVRAFNDFIHTSFLLRKKKESRGNRNSLTKSQKKVTRFTFKESLLFFFPFLRGSFF